MKRAALILLVLGLMIFVALGAYLFLSQGTEVPQNSGTPSGNPFGFSTNTSGTSEDRTLMLVTEDGKTLYAQDFTASGQPDWAGPDSGYSVAGDGASAFSITYYPAEGAVPAQFSISLLAEPLGETRLKAEAALRERTGLTSDELCSLDAQVFTSIHVNETYAGYDLGISSCAGATPLP